MSRPLRIQYSGAWYHVMNRGRRRENIFNDASDYHLFLEVLKDLERIVGRLWLKLGQSLR